MNSTLRGPVNTTACVVQIIGWCEFSQGAQTGIILSFIVLGIVACCCYCAFVQEEKFNIYR
jgi:hypothetical protein